MKLLKNERLRSYYLDEDYAERTIIHDYRACVEVTIPAGYSYKDTQNMKKNCDSSDDDTTNWEVQLEVLKKLFGSVVHSQCPPHPLSDEAPAAPVAPTAPTAPAAPALDTHLADIFSDNSSDTDFAADQIR